MRRYDQLVVDQGNFRSTWQDLAEFFTPYKANITVQSSPGTRKTQRLFDSTGVVAASTLSSQMLGSLANAAQDWYSIAIRQRQLNTLKRVRDWCEEVTSVSLSALAASNFYTELSEVFVDLPIFAIGGLYIEERDPVGPNRWGGMQYTGQVIGQYVCAENREGRIDTVFRKFTLPAREVVARRGWTPSDAVTRLAKPDAKPDEAIEILHAVYPREDGDRTGRRGGQRMPFASCYLEAKTRHVLAEGGYEEFPYAIARWSKDSQSVYGWAPGSIAYPDVRTLNRYVELDLGARGKAVDPPLMMRHQSVLGSLSLEPASVSVIDADGPLGDSIMPLESKARFDVSMEGLQRLESKIDKVFYGPLMRDLDRQKTATEAHIIADEVMRLLGPAAARMQRELLSHAIERTLAIMFRAGELPPPPEALLQAGFRPDLDIIYEGPLARAQRSRDLIAIQRKNQWLVEIAAFDPNRAATLADNYDWDAEARHVAEVVGYPSDLVHDEDAVTRLREQRAQAQAQAAKLQMIAVAAEAAGKAAPMVKAVSDARAQQQPQEAAA